MKSSFLARLQRVAGLSLAGSLLLLVIVPGLQLTLLDSQGYTTARTLPQTELIWIQSHTAIFLIYSVALLLGFALLIGMPFALFRIIIAQEVVGRAEMEKEVSSENEADEEDTQATHEDEQNGMPGYAWRGKGFAVIAAWAGLLGLILVAGGILANAIYLWSSSAIVGPHTPLPGNFASVSSIFALLTYTIGDGGVALSCLFFGISIARSGRRLWPDSWVAFGYAALAVGAIACGSAVQVALSANNQATLTTPDILLFALWSLWFGIMVVRLKAE